MASQHAEGGEEVVLVVDDADGGPAKSSGGGGLVGAYFTLLTGAIGVGILSFPYAFRSAGLAGNLFLGLAFAVLNAYTLWVLASLAHRYGPHLRQFATYEALVHHVLGRPYATNHFPFTLYIFFQGKKLLLFIHCYEYD